CPRKVEDAGWAAPVREGTTDGPERVGDVGGRGRPAPLVIDNRQRRALGPKPEHRLYEVLAMGGKDPGRAQDRVLAAGRNNCPFAGELGFAVDTQRGDRIVLRPGAGARSVKHIV